MLKTLVNVEPIHELRSMEDMFERFFGQPSRPVPATATLPVDVTERDGNLIVRAAVPGVDPSALEITIENNVLSIRGESKSETNSEQEKVYRREVSYGAFSRSIRLPEKLNLDAVSADFNHGMVSVSIPRLPEVKPEVRKIQVNNLSGGTNGSLPEGGEQPANN
jgi:HSP20 family protein